MQKLKGLWIFLGFIALVFFVTTGVRKAQGWWFYNHPPQHYIGSFVAPAPPAVVDVWVVGDNFSPRLVPMAEVERVVRLFHKDKVRMERELELSFRKYSTIRVVEVRSQIQPAFK